MGMGSSAEATAATGTLRHDFDSANLDIPLKDAPIVSLRALENGEEHVQGIRSHKGISFVRNILMTFRRRPLPCDRKPPSRHLGKDKYPERTRRWSAKILLSKLCIALPVLVLCFFGVVHITNVFMSLVPIVWDDDDHAFLPDWGQPGALGEGLSNYPTDFTRDISPIPCHSHNDYWRRVPLFGALHYGCTGVEADVWLFDNDLFVGHNTVSLTKNRTFRNMYVDPLRQILDKQNPKNNFSGAEVGAPKHGVFDEKPEQTVVLLVDFKNSGSDIFPVVTEQLSALREKGYLTYFNGERTISGPITVVATGNAPYDLLVANTTYRDIFFDAALDLLFEEPSDDGFGPHHRHRPHFTGQPSSPPSPSIQPKKKLRERQSGQGTVGISSNSTFNRSNSYYASVSFRQSIGRIWGGRLSSQQMKLIRGQIQGARSRGLKARYWATPEWPIGLRNHVWEVLVREGVGYLNGDDLRGMTRLDWQKRKHHGWVG